MSNEQYLRGLLQQQNLSSREDTTLRNLRDTIEGQLKNSLRNVERVYYAGSFGKTTMIRAQYDLDIVVYWATNCGFTLQDIYYGVGNVLRKHWKIVNSKTVAWEIPFDGGFHIDVVPGRALDNTFKYANLYRTDTQTSLQTSIKVHIDKVRNSGRREVIRLIKLWRQTKRVPFKKSLALELITIEGCSGTPMENLERQLISVFRYIAEKIRTVRLLDPGNTNNVVSDEIVYSDRLAIQAAAKAALGATYWSQVF